MVGISLGYSERAEEDNSLKTLKLPFAVLYKCLCVR